MKYLICLFVIYAVSSMSKGELDEDKIKLMMGMAKECQAKEGASDAEFDALIKHQQPESKSAKCLHACMMEKIGIISDGKFAPDAAVEAIRMLTNDDEKKVNVAKEISEECKGVSNADRCELSINIMECSMAGAKKRGINPHEMR